ncbi:MAG: hypothetical protein U5K43_05270 [Halofilum sp. (in: g-proteobacteria)]|nr:hypothetical protein [Halofilum sp. (in: g-proteobacteria)]
MIQGRPGQIFDPLRDLLDRFSTVILVAIGSLTLQKVLLELSGDVALAVFGAGAAFALGLGVLAGRARWARPLAACAGLLLATALFLRLLLPLAAVGVAAFSGQVLAERQDTALATVERAAGRVGMDLDLRAPRATGDDSAPVDRGRPAAAARRGACRTSTRAGCARCSTPSSSSRPASGIETLVAPLVILLLLWGLGRRLAGVARYPGTS